MVRSDSPRDEVDSSKLEVRPGEHIMLMVVDTELRRVHYTMRRTDTLHDLMDFYYASVPDVSYGSGQFRFDGNRLRGSQTATELLLEDGDEVEFCGGEMVQRKPATRPAVFIMLKVVDPDRRRVLCTMRRTDTLHGLMDLYYASVPDVSYGSGKFSFDGGLLRGCQTAAELLMEDGDTIDFFPDQCLNIRKREMQIFVKTPTGSTIRCTMRRTDTLQVLMDQYLDWYYHGILSALRDEGRFIFAGRQLHGSDTPAGVKLEDSSTVHHVLRLRGS